MENEDSYLILNFLKGSEKAFKKLVEKYYQDAFAMAVYWTRNRETALDISQEAFIRIHKNLFKFDVSKPFKAWLYTIVKNLSLNHLKRTRRRLLVFTDLFHKKEDSVTNSFVTPDNSNAKEIHQLVWWALKQLKERDREIILLKDFENFSYKEIGEILDIPVGTVMSRLYHARKNLAKLLEIEKEVIQDD